MRVTREIILNWRALLIRIPRGPCGNLAVARAMDGDRKGTLDALRPQKQNQRPRPLRGMAERRARFAKLRGTPQFGALLIDSRHSCPAQTCTSSAALLDPIGTADKLDVSPSRWNTAWSRFTLRCRMAKCRKCRRAPRPPISRGNFAAPRRRRSGRARAAPNDGEGELIDLRSPARPRHQAADPHRKRSRRALGFPPFGRASSRRRGAGALSQREARHRPADRHRLFLRISAR